jgi:hypothetical protein
MAYSVKRVHLGSDREVEEKAAAAAMQIAAKDMWAQQSMRMGIRCQSFGLPVQLQTTRNLELISSLCVPDAAGNFPTFEQSGSNLVYFQVVKRL